MNEHYFPGQHSDEKILYEMRPHDLPLFIRIIGIIILSVIIFVLSAILAMIHPLVTLIGILLAFAISGIGITVSIIQHKGAIGYITDRRIIRFEKPHPFHTAVRSLNWDDVMKVKTYPPNFIWSMLNIGTIVVRARASTTSFAQDTIQREVSGDDLEVHDVWYYQDLGNYIEKILHTYKQNPQELQNFRSFIPMPRGQRF